MNENTTNGAASVEPEILPPDFRPSFELDISPMVKDRISWMVLGGALTLGFVWMIKNNKFF